MSMMQLAFNALPGCTGLITAWMAPCIRTLCSRMCGSILDHCHNYGDHKALGGAMYRHEMQEGWVDRPRRLLQQIPVDPKISGTDQRDKS